MNCPNCERHVGLRLERLEPALPARECPQCRGHWIQSADYRRWRQGLSDPVPTSGEMVGWVATAERKLRRCPEDGRILARLRIGSGVPFFLDYCRGCEGMWFDRGEWSALVERKLHDDLLQIVFEEYQTEVTHEQRREAHSEFERRLGEGEYEKLREFKIWIDRHPERARILAFLNTAPEIPVDPHQS